MNVLLNAFSLACSLPPFLPCFLFLSLFFFLLRKLQFSHLDLLSTKITAMTHHTSLLAAKHLGHPEKTGLLTCYKLQAHLHTLILQAYLHGLPSNLVQTFIILENWQPSSFQVHTELCPSLAWHRHYGCPVCPTPFPWPLSTQLPLFWAQKHHPQPEQESQKGPEYTAG